MKKSTACLLFAVYCLLFSCKTIQLTDFNVGSPIQNKLPALEYNSELPANNYLPMYYGSYMVNTPQNDARSMFNKLIQDDVSNPVGEKYGYASYDITIGVNKLGGMGYYMLSIFTLTMPNLFGLPYFIAKSSVEVNVKISDSNKELIGIYKSTGETKTYVAYYYGYGMMDALRAANIKALQAAFTNIGVQIEKESSSLIQKLKEKGPIKK